MPLLPRCKFTGRTLAEVRRRGLGAERRRARSRCGQRLRADPRPHRPGDRRDQRVRADRAARAAPRRPARDGRRPRRAATVRVVTDTGTASHSLRGHHRIVCHRYHDRALRAPATYVGGRPHPGRTPRSDRADSGHTGAIRCARRRSATPEQTVPAPRTESEATVPAAGQHRRPVVPRSRDRAGHVRRRRAVAATRPATSDVEPETARLRPTARQPTRCRPPRSPARPWMPRPRSRGAAVPPWCWRSSPLSWCCSVPVPTRAPATGPARASREPESAVPASVVAFARIDVNPGLRDKLDFDSLVKKFPTNGKSTTDVVTSVEKSAATSAGLDYTTDVKPWFAGQAGVAAWPDAAGKPVVLLVFASKDDARGEEGAREGAGEADQCAVRLRGVRRLRPHRGRRRQRPGGRDRGLGSGGQAQPRRQQRPSARRSATSPATTC